MRTRQQCKGTNFDHLVGVCPQCNSLVMYSDSVTEVIENVVINFHRKCFDKVKLASA